MDTISQLEKLRHENIARNATVLQSLGFRDAMPSASQDIGESTKATLPRPRKRQMPDILQGTRRSVRVASLPGVDYKDKADPSRGRRTPDKSNFEESGQDMQTGTIYPLDLRGKFHDPTCKLGFSVEVKPLIDSAVVYDQKICRSSRSSSELSADLSVFIGETAALLGRPALEYGKKAIMAYANGDGPEDNSIKSSDAPRKEGAITKLSGFETRIPPKFNKYSGVAEWRNCLFLWVNASCGSAGGEKYVNTFTEGGRLMNWFGGSRMYADSRVVKRLLDPRNRSKRAYDSEDASQIKREVLISDRNNRKESETNAPADNDVKAFSTPEICKSIALIEPDPDMKPYRDPCVVDGEVSHIVNVRSNSSSSSCNSSSLSVGQEQQIQQVMHPNTTLLFVREDGGNYYCLGRVAYAGFDLGVNPIQIQWELLDFDAFHLNPEFQRIARF